MSEILAPYNIIQKSPMSKSCTKQPLELLTNVIEGKQSNHSLEDNKKLQNNFKGVKASRVGYSSLPKQIYQNVNKRSFNLNILIIGTAGLGKSTFLNCLFSTDIYNKMQLSPSVRYIQQKDACSRICSMKFKMEENNVKLSLNVVDVPEFGQALDNSLFWEPVMEEINRRNAKFMARERKPNRATVGSGAGGRIGISKDPLIHACFYFIPPLGHGLRKLDIETMRKLCDKVNVIPVIAKSDTMTPVECKAFKTQIKCDLAQENIQVYDFPSTVLETRTAFLSESPDEITDNMISDLREAKRMRLRQPFAVACSNTDIKTDSGVKVLGRSYPWGNVEMESLEHSDFKALKTLLMRYYMQDLIDVTHFLHFANYRLCHFSEIMEKDKFNDGAGREPLCQLEDERKAFLAKLDKLKQEMDSVYIEKVTEREKILKDTENDISVRIDLMRKQLMIENQELDKDRQRYDQVRLDWEKTEQNKLSLNTMPQRWWHVQSRLQSRFQKKVFADSFISDDSKVENFRSRSKCKSMFQLRLRKHNRAASAPAKSHNKGFHSEPDLAEEKSIASDDKQAQVCQFANENRNRFKGSTNLMPIAPLALLHEA